MPRLLVALAALAIGCGPVAATVLSLDNDLDRDGLDDALEEELGTDPENADTDGDGLPDGAEVDEHGTDPLNADTDGDSLSDGDEVLEHSTDPLQRDTDSDGLSDGAEINQFRTDPLSADTDGGSLPDGAEVEMGRDPLDPSDDLGERRAGFEYDEVGGYENREYLQVLMVQRHADGTYDVLVVTRNYGIQRPAAEPTDFDLDGDFAAYSLMLSGCTGDYDTCTQHWFASEGVLTVFENEGRSEPGTFTAAMSDAVFVEVEPDFEFGTPVANGGTWTIDSIEIDVVTERI